MEYFIRTNRCALVVLIVELRLWINWPRPKCAFVPVSIKLEVSELCGRIRFGVRRNMSFMSFIDEPYTRFSVESEVGDQYKLKNLPKLSSVIVNKLKKHIREKMVYPNSFKFRLIWPRTWWPEGSENLFRSETTVPSSSSEAEGTHVSASHVSGTEPVPDGEEREQMGSRAVATKAPTTRENMLRWFSRPGTTTAAYSEVKRAGSVVGGASAHSAILQEGAEPKLEEHDENMSPELESVFPVNHITRTRSEGKRLAPSPTARGKRNLVTQDHVRMYVSTLLASAASGNTPNVFLTKRAADDIYVRDKQFASESVAIVRTRSHSIADFRHETLEGMWAEFLGSIGHDFGLLQTNGEEDAEGEEEEEAPKRGRRFSSLMTWRSKWLGVGRNLQPSKFLRGQSGVHHDYSSEDEGGSISNSSHHGGDAGFLRFGKKILNTHRSLQSASQKQSQQQPVTPPESASKRKTAFSEPRSASPVRHSSNVASLDNGHARPLAITKPTSEISVAVGEKSPLSRGFSSFTPAAPKSPTTTSTPTSIPEGTAKKTAASSYGHKLGLVVGAIAGGVRGHGKKDVSNVPAGYSKGSRGKHLASAANTEGLDDMDESQLEKEVMNLTWQAHALAISQAAEKGEPINMQNFMHTPYPNSPKEWVVMRDGFLIIYPNHTSESGAVEKGQPIAKYNLAGCTCRPLEQPLGFEVGFVVGSPIVDSMLAPVPTTRSISTSSHDTTMEWVQFYTETDIHCRAWVMALQHSADLKLDHFNRGG